MSRPPVLARGDSAFYRLVRGALALTLAPAHRIEAHGVDYLPSSGPALIAVNHKSDVDPFYVGICFRRPLRFLAKAELFDNRVVGWLCWPAKSHRSGGSRTCRGFHGFGRRPSSCSWTRHGGSRASRPCGSTWALGWSVGEVAPVQDNCMWPVRPIEC